MIGGCSLSSTPTSPRDRHELDDPEAHILAHGGLIFMAEVEGPSGREVLGTCALLLEPDGTCELAKMAVQESARGRGVGRALAEAAIALYRALGFVEVPLTATEYARANIRITLEFDSSGSNG